MKLAEIFAKENTDMSKIRTELVLNHNVFKDDAKLKNQWKQHLLMKR